MRIFKPAQVKPCRYRETPTLFLSVGRSHPATLELLPRKMHVFRIDLRKEMARTANLTMVEYLISSKAHVHAVLFSEADKNAFLERISKNPALEEYEIEICCN